MLRWKSGGNSKKLGRIRCLHRIRQSMPDATLLRLIRPTTAAESRPDKAFTPHPA
ncbi:hypothetical protein EC958_4492 [Escherichia coli O25b:H4-ST131]|uniref:Mannitol-1-phosphate 5-dehydrogenase n=1 Tax=Escherichia coli O25b:H4-ST131 TaxID=941322 RepID=A0AA36PAE6_ECOLX|nr:hypothetical protein HMPREF1607_02273 [Escherichia coli 908524]CDN84882.1 hypothetical protein EC958_4492 [Escherichia coli O25b:H4-ST131]